MQVSFLMHVTCQTHLILFDLIILKIPLKNKNYEHLIMQFFFSSSWYAFPPMPKYSQTLCFQTRSLYILPLI
jgi:hypothetical protein